VKNIMMSILGFIFLLASQQTFAESISIMAYNTENAFDVKHDDGKDDYTFLPIGFPGKEKHCYANPVPYYREMCLRTDWTADKAEVKIHQMKRMISAAGFLPDIVGLEEVENETVVGNLARDLGYEKFLVTNSPDARGIDVALLYNHQKLTYLDHEEIVLSDAKFERLRTRNILRVNFKLKSNGAILGVYVNHWPSQAKTSETRMIAAKALVKDLKAQQRNQGKADYYAVAIGDFNTTEIESPNPVESMKASLVDIQVQATQYAKGKRSGLEGTYFFKSKFRWERLDRILMTKNLISGGDLKVDLNSFTIVKPGWGKKDYTEQNPKNPNYGKTMRNVPIPYDFSSTDPNTAGFSDHFPVLINIDL
jgi:endonuclease/exonuclease/phosphatase family metal-dependent hydrolase